MAIARRSTLRKARIALARRLAIIMHAMRRYGTEPSPCNCTRDIRPPELERRPREGADDGADSVACGQYVDRLRFQPSRSAPQLTPSSTMRARRKHRHPTTSPSKSSCCPLSIRELNRPKAEMTVGFWRSRQERKSRRSLAVRHGPIPQSIPAIKARVV